MPSRGQQPDPTEARHAGAPQGGMKDRPPECFPSNAADSPVLHAVTGDALGPKVGSAGALVLFRVTDSSGLYNEDGYRVTERMRRSDDSAGKTPNQLYYRTPSEFETHWGQPAPPSVIEAWTARVDRLFPEGALQEEEWETYVAEDPLRLRGRGCRSIGQAC